MGNSARHAWFHLFGWFTGVEPNTNVDTNHAESFNQKRDVHTRQTEALAKPAVKSGAIKEIFDIFLRGED